MLHFFYIVFQRFFYFKFRLFHLNYVLTQHQSFSNLILCFQSALIYTISELPKIFYSQSEYSSL